MDFIIFNSIYLFMSEDMHINVGDYRCQRIPLKEELQAES